MSYSTAKKIELGKSFQAGWAAMEDCQFTYSERIRLLKAYGSHSMAFSAMQPGMDYFDIADAGYIAFRRHWGNVVALGNPVCAKEDRSRLLDAFLEKYPNPIFIQLTPDIARLLHEKTGFYATQFGRETKIDLENWSLSGKKKQVIRTAINRAKKENITIRETCSEAEYKGLSDEWLETRRCRNREISFLIRPMDMEYTEGIRSFFAYRGKELIGFAFFDPVYENGLVLGYVPNVSRASEKFPQGVFYLLMAKAFKTFKQEEIPFVFLGLTPLALDYPLCDFESGAVRKILEIMYHRMGFIYNFKGLDFTKSRFRGETEPTYVLHKKKVPVMGFATMFRLCNII